jgi:hypothetical protein
MRRTPLHVARASDDDPSQFDTLASYDIAYGFIEVATELWRLAGNPDRANAIEGVITSAYGFEPARLERDQIAALRDLLEGLEQALVGTLTDEHHMLSAAKVEELRGHVKTLDFDWNQRVDGRSAVQEALIYVDHLRNILDEALAASACILFD